MRPKSQKLLPYLIIVLLVVIDQATKYWVQSQIFPMNFFHSFPYGGYPLFKDFMGIEGSIVHATNKGAAWSLMADYQIPLVWLRMFLIGAILLYFVFFNKHPAWQMPLALILAGAISNVLDYFLYGHVIDMVYLVFWGYSYPVFNLADSLIFIGVFWLMFSARCK